MNTLDPNNLRMIWPHDRPLPTHFPNRKAMEVMQHYMTHSLFGLHSTAVELACNVQPDLKAWLRGGYVTEVEARHLIAFWRNTFEATAQTEADVLLALGVRRIRGMDRHHLWRRHEDLKQEDYGE